MDPLPRTIILHPVSCSSCFAVIPRGPNIRPTKLNWNTQAEEIHINIHDVATLPYAECRYSTYNMHWSTIYAMILLYIHTHIINLNQNALPMTLASKACWPTQRSCAKGWRFQCSFQVLQYVKCCEIWDNRTKTKPLSVTLPANK